MHFLIQYNSVYQAKKLKNEKGLHCKQRCACFHGKNEQCFADFSFKT